MLLRIVRASGGGRRAGQRHLTPLVGREEEIAILVRRWERARQGDGQLVLIVGEPGLGKSRLIEELRIRLRDMPHTWTEWSCSQLRRHAAVAVRYFNKKMGSSPNVLILPARGPKLVKSNLRTRAILMHGVAPQMCRSGSPSIVRRRSRRSLPRLRLKLNDFWHFTPR